MLIHAGRTKCAFVPPVPQSNPAVLLFTDNFSTNNFSYTENGVSWGANEGGTTEGDAVAVVSSGGNPGHCMQLTFGGDADLADIANAGKRFNLGQQFTEVTIKFDFHVPSNYVHRDSTSSDNNKLLRLWPVAYEDRTKVGCSLLYNGGFSRIRSEWYEASGGFTTRGAAAVAFITEEDLNTWISVDIYIKAATVSTMGTMIIKKNGVTVIDNTEVINNYNAGGDQDSYRYGYLFGTADSGFTETTIIKVDNVQFYSGDA